MTYERAIEILADRALYDYRAMKVGLDLHTEIRAHGKVSSVGSAGDSDGCRNPSHGGKLRAPYAPRDAPPPTLPLTFPIESDILNSIGRNQTWL
ncbi:MAG: hypothetical protein WAQ27_00515 [Candidatus Microsaccharimonas sp.]